MNQGRDKHFRTVHVRTTLENGSIPYKPGAKKTILKLVNSLSNNRTELSLSSKENLKVAFIVLHFSEQKMQKTNRKEQQVYLHS